MTPEATPTDSAIAAQGRTENPPSSGLLPDLAQRFSSQISSHETGHGLDLSPHQKTPLRNADYLCPAARGCTSRPGGVRLYGSAVHRRFLARGSHRGWPLPELRQQPAVLLQVAVAEELRARSS